MYLSQFPTCVLYHLFQFFLADVKKRPGNKRFRFRCRAIFRFRIIPQDHVSSVFVFSLRNINLVAERQSFVQFLVQPCDQPRGSVHGKRCLITCGTAFVGGHLIRLLADQSIFLNDEIHISRRPAVFHPFAQLRLVPQTHAADDERRQ